MTETAEIDRPPRATAPSPLLSVRNIEVVYDDVILVLRGLSLEVPQGAIVALLGANGAGKSTTLKAISGLLKTEDGEVTRGEIVFDGERINGIDPNNRSTWPNDKIHMPGSETRLVREFSSTSSSTIPVGVRRCRKIIRNFS